MMFPIAKASRIRRALLLATGQTTSYGSGAGMDDGALQKGEAHRYTVLTDGQYSGTVNITLNGKTDVHSNACVMDDATGLMWSRTISASVGPTSNGLLPWTTNGSGEGIFAFCSAANAAGLAGYSNWRVPNLRELIAQCDYEAPTAAPDSTAFPSIATQNIYSATTTPSNSANAMFVAFGAGGCGGQAKTLTAHLWLVRGPVS